MSSILNKHIKAIENFEPRADRVRGRTPDYYSKNDVLAITGLYTDAYPTFTRVTESAPAPLYFLDQNSQVNSGRDNDKNAIGAPWKRISGLDTSGKAVGDPVFLDKSTAGGWVHAGDSDASTTPIGRVIVVSATDGAVLLHNGEKDAVTRSVEYSGTTDVTVKLPGNRWRIVGVSVLKGTGTGASGDSVALTDGTNTIATVTLNTIAEDTNTLATSIDNTYNKVSGDTLTIDPAGAATNAGTLTFVAVRY